MHRHRVLLIEDEKELAELLGELLADLGYEVRIAASMGAARMQLAAFAPCAVVTDLTLPDVERSELVPTLRPLVGGAPIVLMSAIAASELRRLAEEQGAEGAISKPFELEQFEQAVRFECPPEAEEEAAPL